MRAADSAICFPASAIAFAPAPDFLRPSGAPFSSSARAASRSCMITFSRSRYPEISVSIRSIVCVKNAAAASFESTPPPSSASRSAEWRRAPSSSAVTMRLWAWSASTSSCKSLSAFRTSPSRCFKLASISFRISIFADSMWFAVSSCLLSVIARYFSAFNRASFSRASSSAASFWACSSALMRRFSSSTRRSAPLRGPAACAAPGFPPFSKDAISAFSRSISCCLASRSLFARLARSDRMETAVLPSAIRFIASSRSRRSLSPSASACSCAAVSDWR